MPTTYEMLLAKYKTATISAKDLAAEYGSHPTRVARLCREGAIKASKVGGNTWRIPLAHAAAFLDGENAKATEE